MAEYSNSLLITKEVNNKLCIICQKQNSKCKVTSSDNGRKKIIIAAEEKKDEVHHRIQLLKEKDQFVYHVDNKCYKQYTKKHPPKNNIDINSRESNHTDLTNNVQTQSSVRSLKSLTPTLIATRRALQNRNNLKTRTPAENFCVICDCIKSSKNGVRKFKLTKLERAEKLLNAATFFKDDVYSRIQSLLTPKDIIEASLYFHSNCLRAYEQSFVKKQKEPVIEDREINDNDEVDNDVNNFANDIYEFVDDDLPLRDENPKTAINKLFVIENYMKNIILRVKSGEIFCLSEISRKINELNPQMNAVSNREIKNFLEQHYKNDVTFFNPPGANQSIIFYSSKISSNDIMNALRTDECIKKTATIIKKSLQNVDFGLENKFCDSNDLQQAWDNMIISQPIITFLSVLLDVNDKELSCFTNNTDEHSDDLSSSSEQRKIKMLRLKTIFQMLCFAICNGKKNIPLQIMTGISVYNASKSKSLITTLNRTGVSISYNMVRKHREQLAKLTVLSSKNEVPLPTHFYRHQFTTGAFDNFDHNEDTLSGLNASHDTVAVLFQNKSETKPMKPKISDSGINKVQNSYLDEIKCQTLLPYSKPTENITLPPSYLNSPNIEQVIYHFPSDIAWIMSRMCGTSSVQRVPSWSGFNSCLGKDNREIQTVGYLPILPYPPTQYDTVYTQLCTFKNVLKQLEQKYLPVACDEGVYRIAKHIQLNSPEEFTNIVLFLGNFHIIKIFLSCIGRYLRDSGVENVFIENDIFGVGVTDQVLKGTHYSRSVKGFLALSEALQRLQLQAFFKVNDKQKYISELCTLDVLYENFCEQDFDEAQQQLNIFENSCQDLLVDFKHFINDRCDNSPLFKYWSNVVRLITLLQNLIRADRTGDWLLHVQTLRNIQGIFHIMDRTNYIRWSSIYLEDMLMLQTNAPEVYEQFLKGRATAKLSNTPFASVSTDQALELTINRSSKSVSGVIGVTQKKNAVTAWGLTYHEFLSIYNYYREIMLVHDDNDELKVKFHHDYSPANIEQSEDIVNKITIYINSHLNPFRSGYEPLRNLVTEQLVDDQVCTRLLNIFEDGEKLYTIFRTERFINQNKTLFEVIPHVNLPSFDSKTQKNLIVKRKKNKIESQRIIELAKERGFCFKKLFTYELSDKNVLFEDDHNLKVGKKTDLFVELEKLYFNQDRSLHTCKDLEACIIIELIWFSKQVNWKGNNIFKDFAESFCNAVNNIIKNQKCERIDFILTSYEYNPLSIFSLSVNNCSRECIDLYRIDDYVPLPQQSSKFWSSTKNKILIQQYLRSYIMIRGKSYWPQVKFFFSAVNPDKSFSNSSIQSPEFLNLLLLQNIEHINIKIILHIMHAAKNQVKNVLLITSDPDMISILLYYWWEFTDNGLQTLWMKLEQSKTSKIVALHTIASTIGMDLCKILPAIYHLTGSNFTSAIGTKNAALKADPLKYIINFGKTMSGIFFEFSLLEAEKYLINVWKKGIHCETFDDLRHWMYHHGNTMSVEDLPSTSASIRLHIMRALYVTYVETHFLQNDVNYNPQEFGYQIENDILVPEKIKTIIPPLDELVPNCTCKKCNRKSCFCLQAELPSTSFCLCKSVNTCQNIFT